MKFTPSPRALLECVAALLAATIAVGSVAAAEPAIREPKAPTIPKRDFKITKYGAKGDGVALDTEAIRAAFEACAKAGGGRVIVPAGKFLTGPIELTSHTALVLEKDAILQAPARFSDFGLPEPLPETQSRIDSFRRDIRPLITGVKLEDVAILGEGTIDGAGALWWAKSDKAAERALAAAAAAAEAAAKTPAGGSAATPKPSAAAGEKPAEPAAPMEKPLFVPRPHLIVLRDCTRVRIQGVALRNSPMFHVVPHHCHDVLVEDVSIISPADAPNTDGIDPANSHDVVIRRCTIDTGDDNIALKGGGVGGDPTENVFVTDCKFLHGHGVSIGSETSAGVRNFLVQNCSFENTGTALRIKSARTKGGVVENVVYRDITMKNVEAAITISLFYDDKKAALKPEAKPVTDTTPAFHNILFKNIVCDGATKKAGEITGLPESPVSDITLENVHITGAASAFTQQDARNLRFLNVDVQTAPLPGSTTPAAAPAQ